MISNVEQRLFRLESEIQALRQWKASVDAQLARLAQQQYAQFPGSGGGGSSTFPVYYDCDISATLAHGGSLAGQTIYKNVNGTRTALSGTFTLYNFGPNAADDITSPNRVICVPNNDSNGTYNAIGVYC